MSRVKLGTAPGYDNVHPQFLLHLGPNGHAFHDRASETQDAESVETSKSYRAGETWIRSLFGLELSTNVTAESLLQVAGTCGVNKLFRRALKRSSVKTKPASNVGVVPVTKWQH